MPGYKDLRRKRTTGRLRIAAWRAKKAKAKAAETFAVVDHADPVGELASWAAESLIVPVGHPRAGQPMVLLDFAVDWLRESWDAHESALSTARKNAKSAIAAVLALGYLCGPLRHPGWRGAIASLDKNKAGELRRQVAEIAEASGLAVKIRKSPYPGVIESDTGTLDTLSADRSAGHSSGYDLVIVDETGLFPERSRDLLAGLRSSVSARNGQIRHISIRGDSVLFREILENPVVVSHVHAASDGCSLDDEAAWRAANPGLGTIKALAYMRSEVARVAGVVSDEPSFRAYDLNLALSPTREMVCSLDAWRAVESTKAAKRNGPAFLGFDAGAAQSMTAAAAYWPQSRRLDLFACFPRTPTLASRGESDGVGRLYERAATANQLWTHGEQVSDLGAFLARLATNLGEAEVAGIAADRFRQSELVEALSGARLPWPTTYRSSLADHLPIFQRRVYGGEIRTRPNLLMMSALSDSEIQRDSTRARLVPARRRARIDPLVAAIHAVSLAAESYRADSEVDALMAV